MVTHCVCCDVSFARLKLTIDRFGVTTLDELRQYVEFGTGCGLCRGYVERVLSEGATAFEVDPVSGPLPVDQGLPGRAN